MDRFEAAAKSGFKAVETQFPYQWPSADLAQKLDTFGLRQVLINAPPGDWEAGERGLAALAALDMTASPRRVLPIKRIFMTDCPRRLGPV